ncbi:MAG: hypothetical protein GX066_01790 [Clostridiaceae bacterium]|nr:hypothetical protein [Clostridiaceae bacterium]
MRQKINTYILMIVFVCTMVVPMGVVYAQSTDFSIIAPSTVGQGEIFDVEIAGTNIPELYAFEFVLSFEPQKLELVSAKTDIPLGFSVGPAIDGTRITFGFTKIGNVPEEKGDISLATLTFRALKAEQIKIDLLSVKVIDRVGDDTESSVYTVNKQALINVESQGGAGDGGGSGGGGGSSGSSGGTKEVKVTGIYVDPSSMVLKVGEYKDISVIITPVNATEKGVQWSSSDVSIAVYDSQRGQVYGKAPGTATITAKSISDSSKTATCTVTVIDELTEPTTIQEEIYFSDIQGHWAKDTIIKMAEKNIIKGMPNGTFNPDGHITRAQFATMIVNALNLEKGGYEVEFTDVKPGGWYYDAVMTAAKTGIVFGVGDNRFAPDLKITREQMAVMIMRAYDYITGNKYAEMEPSSQMTFTDDANISSWAKKAVYIANDMKIIMGMPNGSFAPYVAATRAEAATMLYRLLAQNNMM